MRRYFIIFILSCCMISGIAQLRLDSLKNLIRKENKADSLLVERILLISNAYTFNHPDSGIYFANSALQLSRKLSYLDGEINAYVSLSQAYLVAGDYAKSLYYSLQASNLFQKTKKLAGVSSMKYHIGDIFVELGDHKKALQYYFDARKIDEGNPEDFRRMYPDLSMEQRLMMSDISIAGAYLAGNRLDSALFFASRAFEKDRELQTGWSYPALILGNVYVARNQFDSALIHYRATFKLAAQNDLIDINNGIAGIHRNRNQPDSCRIFAKKALDTAQVINYPKGAMRASELLSWAYEKKDPVEAIRFYKKSIAIKDSLFNQERVSRVNGLMFEEKLREQEVNAERIKYRNGLKMFGVLTVLGVSLLVALFLWRINRQRLKAFGLLQQQKEETDQQKLKAVNALEELKATQAQLLQREKMASLGELTSGIAHEIQNPLNFVNNFSEVNKELLSELNHEIEKGNYAEVKTIAADITDNEEKISHHGKRADSIVKGMLQHSRTATGVKEPTDINALADEYLRLAYHGLRSRNNNYNATLITNFDDSVGNVNIVSAEIGRVLLNLYNNAFYSVSAKASAIASASANASADKLAKAEAKQLSEITHEESATADAVRDKQKLVKTENQSDSAQYEPEISVTTQKKGKNIEITVRDNGDGVPEHLLSKIFQPFFTTKPTGQGTGLGLSLSYDIIKAHQGEIKINNRPGRGVEFIITLPG